MVAKFRRELDNENLLDRHHSTTLNRAETNIDRRTNEQFEQQKDELLKKDLELKNKELELLKRENELLRQNSRTIETTKSTELHSGSIFSFKDVEGSLNLFSGDDDYTVEKWIDDVNEAAVGVGWNSAKNSLSGTAKQSLRTTKDDGTWEKLELFLRKEFKRDTISSKVHKKMGERKKLTTETYHSYLLTLQEIALAANIDDASIIDYCICGINDVMANKNILIGARDMSDFKSKLNLYADLKEREGSDGVTAAKSVYHKAASSERRNIKCFNCGGIGHRSSRCRNKSKGPKCYKCGDFGHISPNCTKVVAEETNKICAAINKQNFTSVTKDLKQIIICNQNGYNGGQWIRFKFHDT